MLSKTEFDVWCNRLNLSHQTQEVIERIRSSEPSRSVGGGSKNVFGRYPSQKMGVTIQFESHKVELPFIYQLEHDEDVLEFYDQPPSIKLDYKGKNGRNLGVLHTPDFFVIRNHSAGWEECKTQEKLKKLSDKSPNRYIHDEEKQWFCPPGVSYASQFGLYYRLRSDSEINWNLQRNLVFLEDYLRTLSECEDSLQKQIIKVVSAQPGIKLLELLSYSDEIRSDDIYTLIAREAIYVDLNNTLLAEPNKCPIFLDKQTQKAYSLMLSTSSYIDDIDSPVINLTIGESIIWDGKALVILHVGETKITIKGEEDKLIELKREQFESLVKQGKITNLSPKPQQTITAYAWDKFYQASPQDQAEALRRYKTIKPYLQGHKPSDETTPARTIRDWKAKYLTAQQKYGCGYLGLLSHSLSKGNRQRKLPQSTLEIIDKYLTEDYETLKQKSLWSVYCSLVSECQRKSVIPPSYKTFSKEVKKRSKYKQTLKRQGLRAAYEKETFYWELSRTTPRH
ncbi:MAG: TnsA endonuclease N-terminal domain-containing protein, partial [Cyanobacteria bacterium J06573_2]